MSKERRFLFFGLIAGYLAIFAAAAYADGKGFVREEVPPAIPYQRAFLSYSDGHELMIVQTKFEGRHDKIGWVVPLPNPPKIATFGGKSDLAYEWASEWGGFFEKLDRYTGPRVIEIGPKIVELILFAWCGLLIASVVAKIRANNITWTAIIFFISSGCLVIMLILIFWVKASAYEDWVPFVIPILALFTSIIWLAIDSDKVLKKKWFDHILRTAPIIILLVSIVASIAFPSLLGARGSSGVEVLEAKTVGDYDTKTIKATNGKNLIEWLNKNGFKYSKEDEDVFNSYISKGWVFATAIINSKASSYDLLTPPLVVWFETKEMVYPLVLTAMESKETEVLLYTYSPTKIKTDERFVLECAEKKGLYEIAKDSFPYGYDEYKKAHEGDVLYGLFDDIPEKALTFKNGFIQKFRGRLTPDKMRSDLVFGPAGDETLYRKHIYKW